jgi:hypothetical protein
MAIFAAEYLAEYYAYEHPRITTVMVNAARFIAGPTVSKIEISETLAEAISPKDVHEPIVLASL